MPLRFLTALYLEKGVKTQNWTQGSEYLVYTEKTLHVICSRLLSYSVNLGVSVTMYFENG